MIVMISDHDSPLVHYWAGKYNSRVGWLFGPSMLNRRKRKVRPWIPYACDNDAFGAHVRGEPFNDRAFYAMLDWVTNQDHSPKWVLSPDVVGNKNATLESWDAHFARLAAYGWPIAFAVQDGMEPNDVPEGADVVFVGGSTEWKWRSAEMFCKAFPRVHVGRVNTMDRLWLCKDWGAESVDGSGWTRHGENAWMLLRLEQFFRNERPAELAL